MTPGRTFSARKELHLHGGYTVRIWYSDVKIKQDIDR